MQKEPSEHEKDITGLSSGLIATLRGDIKEADAIGTSSAQNAAVAANNAAAGR
jgi:hypothetical protein